MAADDLENPLGQHLEKKRGKASKRLLPAAACRSLGGALGFLAGVSIGGSAPAERRGGEPFAIAPIQQGEASKPASKQPPSLAAQSTDNAKTAPGARTVTIIDGKSGARQEIVIRDADPDTAAAATNNAAINVDARLVDTSRHGPIPKVGDDGAKPLDVYASAGARNADRRVARIAVVVGGLGISPATTGDAIAKLPDSITLAFAPYGNDLGKLAVRARDTGHEIMLQLPMEPFDYPDNDPGPQTLLTSATREQNLDRLHWMMSRIQGYVGVTNYMGARFSATEKAFTPVVSDIGKRGLIYLDDGSSPRSIAAQSAKDTNAPFLKADLVVDASPTGADIAPALAKLEVTAASKGVAVGTATALPISIERIARWAKAAASRGIHIVPVSAILPKPKQS